MPRRGNACVGWIDVSENRQPGAPTGRSPVVRRPAHVMSTGAPCPFEDGAITGLAYVTPTGPPALPDALAGPVLAGPVRLRL